MFIRNYATFIVETVTGNSIEGTWPSKLLYCIDQEQTLHKFLVALQLWQGVSSNILHKVKNYTPKVVHTTLYSKNTERCVLANALPTGISISYLHHPPPPPPKRKEIIHVITKFMFMPQHINTNCFQHASLMSNSRHAQEQ